MLRNIALLIATLAVAGAGISSASAQRPTDRATFMKQCEAKCEKNAMKMCERTCGHKASEKGLR